MTGVYSYGKDESVLSDAGEARDEHDTRNAEVENAALSYDNAPVADDTAINENSTSFRENTTVSGPGLRLRRIEQTNYAGSSGQCLERDSGRLHLMAADDSWSFLTRWNPIARWRTPGLYDDAKAGAARNFNKNEFQQNLKNVNFRYSDGSTPLTRALKSNDQTTVELLLHTRGIDLEFPEKIVHGLGCVYSEPSMPPLIVAVQSGHLPLVKLILDAGVTVNTVDGESYSALYHSVDNGYTDITKLLIQQSPDLGSRYYRYDPIHVACRHGKLDLVKLLVTAGCDVDPDKAQSCVSPLHNAMDHDHELISLYLLEHGADVNNNGNCDLAPFLTACKMGLSKVVDFCIQAGCDINMVSEDRIPALVFAVKHYNYLEQRTLLFETRGSGMSDIVSLELNVQVLYHRRVCILKSLCAAGCKLDTEGASNSTALCHALKIHNLPAAVVLLKHGAKWNKNCLQSLIELHKYLHQHNVINSRNLFVVKKYIPKIITLIEHKERMKFARDTNTQYEVPHLKDGCRQVIRERLKQQWDLNPSNSCSIIPLIPSLNVPLLFKNYLCYNEIEENDYSNLINT